MRRCQFLLGSLDSLAITCAAIQGQASFTAGSETSKLGVQFAGLPAGYRATPSGRNSERSGHESGSDEARAEEGRHEAILCGTGVRGPAHTGPRQVVAHG